MVVLNQRRTGLDFVHMLVHSRTPEPIMKYKSAGSKELYKCLMKVMKVMNMPFCLFMKRLRSISLKKTYYALFSQIDTIA